MSSKSTHAREIILKRSTGKKPKGSPRSKKLDFGLLKEAVAFMTENGLVELTWEREGEKLSLKSGGAYGGSAPVITFNPPGQIESKSGEEEKVSRNQLQIVSPFVGTYYRAPAPGAEPYVAEGAAIKPGSVLCIVEAMKLMNEIESEVSGRITKVLVEDGQPVEFGEPLFLYEK